MGNCPSLPPFLPSKSDSLDLTHELLSSVRRTAVPVLHHGSSTSGQIMYEYGPASLTVPDFKTTAGLPSSKRFPLRYLQDPTGRIYEFPLTDYDTRDASEPGYEPPKVVIGQPLYASLYSTSLKNLKNNNAPISNGHYENKVIAMNGKKKKTFNNRSSTTKYNRRVKRAIQQNE